MTLNRIMAAAMALCLGLAWSSVAEARWLKAESPRFIVYSDGDERVLRNYVQKLETFDSLLRALHGMEVRGVPERKLTLYLVGSTRDLQVVRPGVAPTIRGFYSASDEDIWAIAIRTRNEDYVLMHEYVHHFMLQNFAYAYPAWLVEGYAEYFMTIDIGTREISVGEPNENRAAWLGDDWPPLDQFFSRHYNEVADRHRPVYYPLAWLVTHYFMSDNERRPQLTAYARAVAEGADPVSAMETASGQTMAQLTRSLQDYMRTRIAYTKYQTQHFPPVEMTVTQLGPVADDLLLLNQRLKVGVREEDRPRTAELVMQAAARHPNDPFARAAAAHAQLHFGERAEGVRLFEALLADHPDHVEALQYLAAARLGDAREAETGEEVDALVQDARRLLARAYELDPLQYRTYLLLAQSREGQRGYPTDNDVDTWQLAYTLAPQLGEIRMGAGRALMMRERYEDAIALLQPVANNPHRPYPLAQSMIEAAKAGLAPPSAEAISEAAREDEAADGEVDPTALPPGDGPFPDREDEEA